MTRAELNRIFDNEGIEENDDISLVFAYQYGDYVNTVACQDIKQVEIGVVEEWEYGRCMKVVEEEELDKLESGEGAGKIFDDDDEEEPRALLPNGNPFDRDDVPTELTKISSPFHSGVYKKAVILS